MRYIPMAFVIRFLKSPETLTVAGCFLVSHNGNMLETTDKPQEAQQFDTLEDAFRWTGELPSAEIIDINKVS